MTTRELHDRAKKILEDERLEIETIETLLVHATPRDRADAAALRESLIQRKRLADALERHINNLNLARILDERERVSEETSRGGPCPGR